MTVLDTKQGWAFVHVPKTGGTSVERALGRRDAASMEKHCPRFLLNDGLTTFGFVRNPWDRMVSQYFFNCQKPIRPYDNFDQQRIRNMGFKAWLMDDAFYTWADLQRDPQPDQPIQRRSQMYWLNGADHIGCFERLQADFAWICRKLGIKASGLSKALASDHKLYRTYYDDEAKAFVARWFAPEIERFGYTF